MKSNIFTIICILLCLQNHAQTATNVSRLSRNDWSSVMKGNQPLMTQKNPDVELRGHPFATDEWYDGTVMLKDSSGLDDPSSKFKLNVENSEIWVLLSDKSEYVLTDNRIVGLKLYKLDKVITYRKYQLPESPTVLQFAQVIYDDAHYSLVKYVKKKFVPADYVDKGVAVIGKKYDSFDEQKAYYIIAPDKKATKISLSKGDILKATAAVSRPKREEILEYCKENDIRNPINEEDAALMLAFINKLK